jgi:hypothetical protein
MFGVIDLNLVFFHITFNRISLQALENTFNNWLTFHMMRSIRQKIAFIAFSLIIKFQIIRCFKSLVSLIQTIFVAFCPSLSYHSFRIWTSGKSESYSMIMLWTQRYVLPLKCATNAFLTTIILQSLNQSNYEINKFGI